MRTSPPAPLNASLPDVPAWVSAPVVLIAHRVVVPDVDRVSPFAVLYVVMCPSPEAHENIHFQISGGGIAANRSDQIENPVRFSENEQRSRKAWKALQLPYSAEKQALA